MPLFSISRTVLKSLFTKPYTTDYPFKPREVPERNRGHIENQIENCIFCGICKTRCPVDAIEVTRAPKVPAGAAPAPDAPVSSWRIDRLRCIQCNCCVEFCPKKCLRMDKDFSLAATGDVIDVLYPVTPETAPKQDA